MPARLALWYFAYFAAVGVFLPFWPVYLRELGFPAAAIGTLLALYSASRLVAPHLWGWLADRSGRRMAIVRAGGAATVLCFAGVFAVGSSFAGQAAVMAVFCFFWTAALPQFEAVTLAHLGRDAHRYGRIRLWGSIGFIVVAAGGGAVVAACGALVIPWAMLAGLVAILVAGLLVPEPPVARAQDSATPLGQLLRTKAVWALIATGFLQQAAHGPYYTFFTLYLGEHGIGERTAGLLWALGVVAEVGLFAWLPHGLPRVGLRRLLQLAVALSVLRWLLLGLAVEVWALLLVAQLLHAASFAAFHACTLQLVQQRFGPAHAGQGQALYSSLGTGAGAAFGAWLAGTLWLPWGGALTFVVAAGCSALAWLLVQYGLHTLQTVDTPATNPDP